MVGFLIFGQSVQSYYIGLFRFERFFCFVRRSLDLCPSEISAR